MQYYTFIKDEDGSITYPTRAEEVLRALKPGKYRCTITQWSASRSERLSRFFHGPVISAYIEHLQAQGYFKGEAKSLLKRAVKQHFKRQYGPEWTYYDPLQKITVREPKSFARSNEPWAISQEEAMQMLQELEVRFIEAGIPWPHDPTYKELKSKQELTE